MTTVNSYCSFEGCMVQEDHLAGINDYHVRDVEHGPVKFSYSIEGGTVRTAAWIPGIAEVTFDPDTIEADLAWLDGLIAGLTEARLTVADWMSR